MESTLVETHLGRVHVTQHGNGRPLVLLHTNGGSWHEFAQVMRQLEADFAITAWDMPGQGDSDPVPAGVRIDDYAAALGDVLDALEIKLPAVAGTSIGGFLAAAYGASRPDSVSALVIVESFLGTPEDWATVQWERAEQVFSIPVQTRAQMAPRFAAPLTDDFVQRWNIDRSKAGSHGMLAPIRAMRDFDVEDALGALRAPVLAVFGGDSTIMQRSESHLAWLPTNTRIAVIPDAGHFIPHDQPQRFAQTLRAFLLEATVASKCA
jgi:3-oxoadipate enol-lactonase